MKKIEFKCIHNDIERVGTILLPESLQEAVASMGHQRVYDLFRVSYLNAMKNQIRYNRKPREKKYAKIDLQKLTPEQRDLLSKAGLV